MKSPVSWHELATKRLTAWGKFLGKLLGKALKGL
jgi:hypothetical protein